MISNDTNDTVDSEIIDATAERVLREALRFNRLGGLRRDPLDCPSCGKPWSIARHADECCAPRGIARAIALDEAENRERIARSLDGCFAIIESDLMLDGSARMDELMGAFAMMRDNVTYTPIRRLVIRWQDELAEQLMTDDQRSQRAMMLKARKRRVSRKMRLKARAEAVTA